MENIKYFTETEVDYFINNKKKKKHWTEIKPFQKYLTVFRRWYP